MEKDIRAYKAIEEHKLMRNHKLMILKEASKLDLETVESAKERQKRIDMWRKMEIMNKDMKK